jgi:hypothetical protein
MTIDENTHLEAKVWTPRALGVITFLILPAGWFLSILNFYRLKRMSFVWAHVIIAVVGTCLLLGLAFSGTGNRLGAAGLLLSLLVAYYLNNSTQQVVNEFQLIGGVVKWEDSVTGFFIGLAATIVWFLIIMTCIFIITFIQTFIFGQDSILNPGSIPSKIF